MEEAGAVANQLQIELAPVLEFYSAALLATRVVIHDQAMFPQHF